MQITDEQYQIILAYEKTILKNYESMWVKTGLDNFFVPMGGYNSAQIADLVGYIYWIFLAESLTSFNQVYTILTEYYTMVLSVQVYRKRL